jgi:hypothetical protein
VLRSLERFRAVFQITPGWEDTYTDRLAKTELPSPFKIESKEGTLEVPTGHLAARLTSRTKGAGLLRVGIPETSLQIYRPIKKGTLCMVIESVEGGELVGSVLSVTKASSKEKKVAVRCLDGSEAREGFLALNRVIVVEPPE